MKVYNYSDLPVSINGHEIDDSIIILNQEIRKPFVTHNGYEFLSNQNTQNRLEHYTIFNGGDGSYKYLVEEVYLPDWYLLQMTLIACIGFLTIIKIVQKLKTR